MIVNCTPHAIALNDGRVFAPSGDVARVRATFTPFEGDFTSQVFGDVEGLPECNGVDTFVVSALVLAALGGKRGDVVAPATGHPETVRKDGLIVSVPGFVRG